VEPGRAAETERAGASSGGGISRPGSSGDSVEFSRALGSLADAMTTWKAGHAAKVDSLAARYRSGAYQADSHATSRAMITQALMGDE